MTKLFRSFCRSAQRSSHERSSKVKFCLFQHVFYKSAKNLGTRRATASRNSAFYSSFNPRPTGGGAFRPYSRFYEYLPDAKLAALFRSSILHPVCKSKIRIYHRLAASDVRVTSCPGDFDAKKVYKNRCPGPRFIVIS